MLTFLTVINQMRKNIKKKFNMAEIPLWTCHCYGRGIHLHRDATSITADFNLFLLFQPSFNVPILLLWVVKTYIQLPYAVQICKFISIQNISTNDLVQRDVLFLILTLLGLCLSGYTKSSSECSNNIWFYIKINISQFSVKAGNL